MPIRIRIHLITLMRIRIQLITLMRIRIQVITKMRTRIHFITLMRIHPDVRSMKIRRKYASLPKPGSRQVLGPVEILEIVLHGGMQHLGMLYHRYVLLGKYQIISTNLYWYFMACYIRVLVAASYLCTLWVFLLLLPQTAPSW
jgi:hypothetical protein